MLVYSQETIATGSIWAMLESGTEVYSDEFTVIEKHAFNDENDVKQLFVKCAGWKQAHRITGWGWL